MPCINFFNTGFNNIAINPTPIGISVKIKKKVPKEYSSEILSIIPPIVFAAFCPTAIAKYQTPNIKPIIRAGTNLLRYESPNGERQSSPIVWNRYAKIKNIILTEAVLAPGGISDAPYDRIANPRPSKTNPIPYFIAALGLYLLSHHFENNGAKVIMKNEFRIPNQVASTFNSSEKALS